MDLLPYHRLLEKSIVAVQLDPENPKKVGTFCRRLGYVEKGSLSAKIARLHFLFDSHKVDVKRALPLVRAYYSRAVVHHIVEVFSEIKKTRSDGSLFTNFSEITPSSLIEQSSLVASLCIEPLSIRVQRWLPGFLGHKVERALQEQLIHQMAAALCASGLEAFVREEERRIAKRAPEKKAALVAEMLFREKRRVAHLEEQIKEIQDEIVQQEEEGSVPIIDALEKEEHLLEKTHLATATFCTKAAEAIVADYNKKEREYLRELAHLKQFALAHAKLHPVRN